MLRAISEAGVEIHEQTKGAVRVIKPIGALVGADAEKLRSRASQALSVSMGKLVVDATAVPFLDSRGLEVLLELSQELSATGQVLRLAGASETVREVLELTDVGSSVEHHEDVNSAVRSFL